MGPLTAASSWYVGGAGHSSISWMRGEHCRKQGRFHDVYYDRLAGKLERYFVQK
jgi:hypothetical protein